MINKSFGSIEKPDIDTLVADKIAEDQTIEFKLTIPGDGDKAKKEFCADISSFANASGGDLIYGMTTTTDGVANGAPGLSGINKDYQICRLTNIILNNIAPRIRVQIKAINGFSNGLVLIVRIPNSWASPHMVTFKGTSRFYVRSNMNKHQMDREEIRSAFILSEAITERIRDFRIDRLSKIIVNETSISLPKKPKIILHLLPFSAFKLGFQIELSKLDPKDFTLNNGISSRLSESRYNLDGLLLYSDIEWSARGWPQKTEIINNYCQIFRNGVIEAVDTQIIKKKQIPGRIFEQNLISSIVNYLEALKKLDITLPIIVMLALIDVKGYKIMGPMGSTDELYYDEFTTIIDRNKLILPEVLINDFNDTSKLRPIFDAVWNASGRLKSPYFDDLISE